MRTGLTTLTRLNREIKNIHFGYDTYALEWDWEPQFKQYGGAAEAAIKLLEYSTFAAPALPIDQALASIFDPN